MNLTGTMQSIMQGISGQKPVFARTPKVRNRTVAPVSYVLVPLLLIAWCAYTLHRDLLDHAYPHAVFATTNLMLTAYACIAFVGLMHLPGDILRNIREFMYKPARPASPSEPVHHWASVLYVGSSLPEETDYSSTVAMALAAEDQFKNGLTSPPDAIPEYIQLGVQH